MINNGINDIDEDTPLLEQLSSNHVPSNFTRLSNHMSHCSHKLLPRHRLLRAVIAYRVSLDTYRRIIDTARALSEIWRTDDRDGHPENCRCIHVDCISAGIVTGYHWRTTNKLRAPSVLDTIGQD